MRFQLAASIDRNVISCASITQKQFNEIGFLSAGREMGAAQSALANPIETPPLSSLFGYANRISPINMLMFAACK